MLRNWRNLATPLFAVGIVLFLVAILGGGNVVFGFADLLIGAAIGIYAAQGPPPGARSTQLYVAGLAVASAAAILDGLLTLADQTGAITDALTFVVVAGAILALVGAGPPRR